LEVLLDSACTGRPTFAVISGEAGIGKTRLLQELVEAGAARGCLTLVGRAMEFERDLPFALFVDALDAYLSTLDPRILDRLALDRLGALAAVFPSMRAIDHALERPVSAAERFVVHRAVKDLVERLAASHPVLLALDDLQWADGASLELLGALLRRPPQAAVMIAMTVRIGHGDDAALDTVRSILQMDSVRSIELGPLSVQLLADLVADAADLDIDGLHHESGGNPFYAIQLARARPDDRREGARDVSGVPSAVIRGITSEMTRLSRGACRLAEAAAVIGDPFDLDLVIATIAIPEDEALAQVDELIARDLLRTTVVPRRFQFRHPLVRSAVYEALLPGARVRYHELAASALEAYGAPPATVAVHVEQSARFGDEVAVSILRQAGMDSFNRAPGSAARWFAAALRILPPDTEPELRLELLMSMAASMAAIGRFVEARDAFDEGLGLLDSTPGELWARLVVGCAGLDGLLGNHQAARERLTRALARVAVERSPEGVSLLIALASTDFFIADFEGSLHWADRAAAAAETLGDRGLLAESIACQAMAAAWAGRIDIALELQRRASELADALSDDELSLRLQALNHLTNAELYLDRFAESCRHGDRCLDLARATMQTQLIPTLVPVLGSSLWIVGEFERSAQLLDEAIEAARLVGNTQGICFSLLDRSLSALMAGDLEVARETGRESVELAGTFDRSLVSVYAGGMYALVLLEEGDAAGAYALLLESGGGSDLHAFAGSWRSMYLEALTRCALLLGRPDEAVAAAAQARREAEELGLEVTAMMADRAATAVCAAGAGPGDSAELALSALRHAEITGSPVFVATACALAGSALAARHRIEEAIACLDRAVAGFDALGAFRYRDRARADLERLGDPRPVLPDRADRSRNHGYAFGLAALSAREREVAELIQRRHTNREIAQELFLGIKTVETHVRHIFEKLAVSSRVEIARIVDRDSWAGAQSR
jgi:DNA-binding CsgD family transcriptional regulator